MVDFAARNQIRTIHFLLKGIAARTAIDRVRRNDVHQVISRIAKRGESRIDVQDIVAAAAMNLGAGHV